VLNEGSHRKNNTLKKAAAILTRVFFFFFEETMKSHFSFYGHEVKLIFNFFAYTTSSPAHLGHYFEVSETQLCPEIFHFNSSLVFFSDCYLVQEIRCKHATSHHHQYYY
jgi:hypothetical protein